MFVVLQPTVVSWWSSIYRKIILNTFITQLEASKQVDPQGFWEFRERYSPGVMSLESDSVGIYQTYRIEHIASESATALLYYQSPLIESIDSVTKDLDVVKKLHQQLPASAKIMVQTDKLLLAKMSESEFQLAFLLPIEEMKKANGFFDYLPQEQKLLDGTMWLNTTTIKIQ